MCDQREGRSLLQAAARLVYTCPLAAYLWYAGPPATLNAFPQLGLIPAVEEGANVSVFPAPSSNLLDLIPATTTRVCSVSYTHLTLPTT